MGHPAGSKRRLRSCHGRRAVRLHPPYDLKHPLVCLDETTKQLAKETREPVPMKKGQPARVDYEYERNGTADMFMMFVPLEGWRHVKVTERRTAIDYAQALKDLSDVHFPDANTIVLAPGQSQHPRPGVAL